jgi:hypothetical protein
LVAKLLKTLTMTLHDGKIGKVLTRRLVHRDFVDSGVMIRHASLSDCERNDLRMTSSVMPSVMKRHESVMRHDGLTPQRGRKLLKTLSVTYDYS